LGQDGRRLVWSVDLARPFSPSALAGDHRSLCLALTRNVARFAVSLCVDGAARSGTPRLVVYPRARAVPATFIRHGARDLEVSFVAAAAGVPLAPVRWQVISGLSRPVCVAGCSVAFPSRPALASLHVPVLAGCVPSGPGLVLHGPGNRREVALTFDDGPWSQPPTSAFLDVLERKHVVATFFEIGNQIDRFDPGGRLERRMLADGDLIGNHSWSHPLMTGLGAAAQQQQLEQTDAAITRATGGFRTCIWRPPYGGVNSSLVSLARSLGLITIVWDIDPRDWARPGTDAIYGNVVGNAHNGAIVLQHFGGGPRYQTLAALPREIDTLRARGYRFVTIPELLGLRLLYR
jgi:peptidoglycan/xylan/chitin deacetylase (PgdA/CDA1 family)